MITLFGLVLFAFTTILGWSVYGERCVEYLFGVRAIMPFRILWVLAIPLGATVKLSFVWLLADTLNALMALPNLIGLLLLSGALAGGARVRAFDPAAMRSRHVLALMAVPVWWPGMLVDWVRVWSLG